MEYLLPFITFGVTFLTSILSGMAGGGGSFIMTPYWLIIGLTPAQGATTGAFTALGLGGGSLAAFRGSEHTPKNKRMIALLLGITIISSLLGPLLLNKIDTATFTPILIGITLVSLPALFLPKAHSKPVASYGRSLRWVLITALLITSSFIASSAFSILITIVLVQLFRLTVLQSTVLRRMVGVIQSIVIFIILTLLGNFVWHHALAGLFGGIAGSYIGTKIAIEKGEVFAKWALVIGAVASICAMMIL